MHIHNAAADTLTHTMMAAASQQTQFPKDLVKQIHSRRRHRLPPIGSYPRFIEDLDNFLSQTTISIVRSAERE
jgi:hypothetical protein